MEAGSFQIGAALGNTSLARQLRGAHRRELPVEEEGDTLGQAKAEQAAHADLFGQDNIAQ